MTPKEVAINLIRTYVERGDDLKSLTSGQMGKFGYNYSAQIGGYINGKKYANDKILVLKIKQKEINEVFSLKEIFNEIKSGNIQKELL